MLKITSVYVVFAITSNFKYFTSHDQHIPGKKWTTGQMNQLLLCLNGSQISPTTL